jgi:hypothetical protein
MSKMDLFPSAATPHIGRVLQSAWDTTRLCESLASLRSIVIILNIGLTEVLLTNDRKEREEELQQYEKRLRRCLDEMCDLKDEFFVTEFRDLTEGMHRATITSTLGEINQERMEHEDLWREFLGLYVACLSFAAKIAGHKKKYDEASQLLAFIIDACVYSGAYLNLDDRSRADGRSVTISRFRARLASALFGQCKYYHAKMFARSALVDLSLGCCGQDPDVLSCLSIVTFLDKRRTRK